MIGNCPLNDDFNLDFKYFFMEEKNKLTFYTGLLILFFLFLDLVPFIFVLISTDRINRKTFYLTINPWISSFLIIRNGYFIITIINYDFDKNFNGNSISPVIYYSSDLDFFLAMVLLIFSLISILIFVYFYFLYFFALRTSRGYQSIRELRIAELRPFFEVVFVLLALACLSYPIIEVMLNNIQFDIFYIIISIGFPFTYIFSSAFFPSFKSYFLWWYQGPLLAQFLILQIITTVGCDILNYIKIKYYFWNLVINISWWLMFLSIVLLQRYRRPFFFLPKEFSPKCFLYKCDINQNNQLKNQDCCFCNESLTEPNSNDPKYFYLFYLTKLS